MHTCSATRHCARCVGGARLDVLEVAQHAARRALCGAASRPCPWSSSPGGGGGGGFGGGGNQDPPARGGRRPTPSQDAPRSSPTLSVQTRRPACRRTRRQRRRAPIRRAHLARARAHAARRGCAGRRAAVQSSAGRRAAARARSRCGRAASFRRVAAPPSSHDARPRRTLAALGGRARARKERRRGQTSRLGALAGPGCGRAGHSPGHHVNSPKYHPGRHPDTDVPTVCRWRTP